MENNIGYYPRRVNWHRHSKIAYLRSIYGREGDSRFGDLCDLIGDADYCLLKFNEKRDKIAVAGVLGMSLEETEKFVLFLADECQLIKTEDGCITTDTAQETLSKINESREEWKEKKRKYREKMAKANGSPPPPEDPAAPKLSKEERERIRLESLKKKKADFGASLARYVEEYGKETVRAFYEYWIEPNKSQTKLKWEMERTWDTELRLKKWKRNEEKFNKGQGPKGNNEPNEAETALERKLAGEA